MEQEQFKIEVVPLRGKLSGCARRLLDDPEDVEDVVQEVFLKLWYIRDELDRYDSVEALAVQITKHLCLNRLRAFRYRQEKLSDSATFAADDNPYIALEQKDSVSQVMHIMGAASRIAADDPPYEACRRFRGEGDRRVDRQQPGSCPGKPLTSPQKSQGTILKNVAG